MVKIDLFDWKIEVKIVQQIYFNIVFFFLFLF